MEPLLKKRTQLRREFTKAADKTEGAEGEDRYETFSFLTSVAERLFATEENLRDVWCSLETFDEAAYEKDQNRSLEYQERYEKLKSKYTRWASARAGATPQPGPSHVDSRNCKLPKLEITKFDGSIKKWLLFWGQFEKIDGDPKLKDIDKFQYLLQSIEPDSPASQLILAYPPSEENYKKAVQALKERFAREDLLIETYVRGLLSLIASQKKEEVTLPVLYDKLQAHLQALDMLGVTKDKYAAILYPMIESTLPEEVLRAWNRSTKENSDLNSLVTFLKQEVESEERIAMAKESFGQKEVRKPTACFMLETTERESKNCIWCNKENHSSTECTKASKMSLEQRVEHVKNKRCCLICLRPNHIAKRCRNYQKCLICSRRHVTIMCNDVNKNARDKPKEDKDKGKNGDTKIENLSCDAKNSTTILQTLCIKIRHAGKEVKVRAIVDSGAQRSYIKKKTINELDIKAKNTEKITHCLFGEQTTPEQEFRVYEVDVGSLDGRFNKKLNLVGQESICGQLPKIRASAILKNIAEQGITLSESQDSPDEVSILIGADYCGSLLTGEVRQLDNGLTAVKTLLGWTIQGPVKGVYSSMVGMITTLHCLDKIELEDLWRLETLGITDPGQQASKAAREDEMLQSFYDTVEVNEEGRYEVQLPWREGMPRPTGNYDAAKKRLTSATARLEALGKTKEYDDVFREWLDEGIIEPAPIQNEFSGLYLPHHPVIKETSLTFKIRPVFDASAKNVHGVSLNACVDKGPSLIELIPDILTGFRKEAIGVTADIARAFLQISLAPEEREYLKFLWWTDVRDPNRSIITYRHKRVVFGVASSPFHLAATIKHHLRQSPDHLKETAAQLREAFYVDNCVTSVKSGEAMRKFMDEAKEIMREGKFDLRCWVTAPEQVEEQQKGPISVLGMIWDTERDTLSCNTNNPKIQDKVTKRGLLSIVQKVFDPIGICCAATITPKIIMQDCWKENVKWDQQLPEHLQKRYSEWSKSIHLLGKIAIPRRLTEYDIAESINTLHTFCDASKQAYAACVFLRSDYGGNVCVRLVMAKSRVSPAAELTIPRLELMASTLATRLCSTVRNALDLKDCRCYFWTDSSIVLTWIKGDGKWPIFVENRVREIKNTSSPGDWRHVAGVHNPADLPSRGTNGEGLIKSKWWEGPTWLVLEEGEWPATNFEVQTGSTELEIEARLEKVLLVQDVSFLDQLTRRFSDYTKIVRTVAWMLRMKKLRKNDAEELMYEEVEYAEKVVFRLIQEVHGNELDKLQTIRDEDGLLRLQTKLNFKSDSLAFKEPVVLPASNQVIQRMVEERHRILMHAGTQTLMSNLRETVWIIGVRSLVKKVVRSCVKCRRYKTKRCQTVPASLPKARVEANAAFERSGVDLAGPLTLKSGKKHWIVLFTCAVFRAVHLEVVESLSTADFLGALRRFIARRGRVRQLISDNGTNFVGLSNTLNKIDWNHVLCFSTITKIKWTFLPPAAPWWGGFYERMISLVKQILRRVLGSASITLVELQTILCDCEAVINSRPLTYVSNQEDDLAPLSPATFIQPISTAEVTDLDIIDGQWLNARAEYCQKLREDFRRRFRSEYLGALVQKAKQTNSYVLQKGDVVLVEIDDKRTNWPLGLVEDLYPGADDCRRVARVKTASGVKVRPLQRLFPLEVRWLDPGLLAVPVPQAMAASRVPDPNSLAADPTIADSTVGDSAVRDTNTSSTEGDDHRRTRSGRVIKMPYRFYD